MSKEELKEVYQIGVSFKMSYSKMIEYVFKALRQHKMIWKRLNSDYVYKCQTGLPTKPDLEDPNEVTKGNYMASMIKYFVQFSKMDAKNQHTTISPMEEPMYI